MAFRGYELNLMLRVQDRATTRLRKLSADIGGVARASQVQRDMSRIALAQNRNSISQAKTLNALQSRTLAQGEKNLQYEAQLLRAKATEIRLQQRLSGLGARNPALRQATMMQLRAIQKDIVRLETVHVAEVQRLNLELKESVALEAQLAREAELAAAAHARAVRVEEFQRKARLVTHAGSVAAMAGGIGLIASGGAAASFANFNRLSAAAATQLRAVNAPIAETARITGVVQTALLDMTRKFPASADEMSKSLYDIASGMDFVDKKGRPLESTIGRFNQSFRLLKLANEAAVAGNVDLETSTEALITVLNNFDPALKRPQKILEQLFAIVRFGKGTFAQFAPQFGRMAAAANAAGQSLNEAGAAVAFLSQRMSQSQAVTAYTRLIQVMNRPEFREGFKSIFKIPATIGSGTNQRLRQLSDLVTIITTRAPGLRKGGTNLADIIKNITARGQDIIAGKPGHVGIISTANARIAATNLIKFRDQYLNTLTNIQGDTNEFSASLAALMKQPGVQWQIALNQFKAFAVVVGQDVLPVMLRFLDFIGNLGHSYENLSPRTKRLIAQFATWGSIVLLVGGAITTIVGAIGILIGRLGGLLGILGPETAAVGIVGRFARLAVILRNIAAIGAITIILKTIWTGDASARDFLMGALFGAGAGAQIGFSLGGPGGALAGAALGAITVPVVLNVASHISNRDVSATHKKLVDAFNAENKRRTRTGETLIGFTEFSSQAMNKFVAKQDHKKLEAQFGLPAFIAAQKARMNNATNATEDAKQTILQKWKDLAAQMTGVDLFGGASAQAAQAATLIGLNLAKAQASGNEAAIKSALQAQIKWDIAKEKELEKLPKTAANVKALTQLYQNQAAAQGQLNSMSKKATQTSEREQKARERANKAYETASRRVDTLKLKFKQLREQEIDKLRSSFGDVFGGPLMQGPIGQIFTQISGTLAGFGKTFPIPASFILKDQKAQQDQFDTLMKDLSFLQKRGVQPKTIQNILSQGASAVPFLEGIRKGSPAQQREFIKNLNARNSSILQALQSPFEKQLMASNTQLQAAKIQMKAAQERVKEAKTGKTKVSTGATKPTSTQTRTTQSVVHHHGDTVTVHADGATPAAVKSALDRHSFDKRNRN